MKMAKAFKVGDRVIVRRDIDNAILGKATIIDILYHYMVVESDTGISWWTKESLCKRLVKKKK